MSVSKHSVSSSSVNSIAQKPVGERTCVACRKRGTKRDFIRLVRTNQGELILDMSSKLPGRGAYVCPQDACFTKLCDKELLARALRMQLSSADYERLREELQQACQRLSF